MLGISGVPRYVVNEAASFSGAQPAETFLEALRTLPARKSVTDNPDDAAQACGTEDVKCKDERPKNKPRALVIGGSLGVCALASVCGGCWRVGIFERSRASWMTGCGHRAAIRSAESFEGLKLATRADISVESLERQYLKRTAALPPRGTASNS